MDPGALKSIPLFASLSNKEREQVARWADEIDLAEGKHLASEGEFAYEFFAIQEGTVEVTMGDQHVRDMGPGEFFGEIALVETERRTATVVTRTPVRVIVMHGRDFRSMESAMPEVADKIREAIRQRPGGR
ncbi:MAG: cyclic nucleotide-binding domain-containing protein [Actinomycetota bacterium]